MLDLADFRDGPVLLVNTASRCGFTPQFDGLQALWERYRGRGLTVVGVPSNSFKQELDSATKVKDFCEVNFAIDFPMTGLVEVIGPDAHPFYRWAAEQGRAPAWNFHKLLLDRDGRIVAGFDSYTRARRSRPDRGDRAAADELIHRRGRVAPRRERCHPRPTSRRSREPCVGADLDRAEAGASGGLPLHRRLRGGDLLLFLLSEPARRGRARADRLVLLLLPRPAAGHADPRRARRQPGRRRRLDDRPRRAAGRSSGSGRSRGPGSASS